MTAAAKADTLHGKISEVMAAIGAMSKDKTVTVKTKAGAVYTYEYLGESALMNAVRKELAVRGVAVYVSVDEQSRVDDLTFVTMSMTFADSLTGQTFTIKGQGQGADPSDKGVYKAITGCTRYMLWKQFLVPTEQDDPNQPIEVPAVRSPVASRKAPEPPREPFSYATKVPQAVTVRMTGEQRNEIESLIDSCAKLKAVPVDTVLAALENDYGVVDQLDHEKAGELLKKLKTWEKNIIAAKAAEAK